MATAQATEAVSGRKVLKGAGAGPVPAEEKAPLAQRLLGKTGVKGPVLGLGTAPAGHRSEKEAVAFFHRCIDSGVAHLDTGSEYAGYGKAQVYLGHVLKDRRKEVFIATKCWEPDGEKALQVLKQNLAELQIDRADLAGPTRHRFSIMPSPRRISSRKPASRAAAKRFLAMLSLDG
jgi:hypothetical protein